MNEIIKYSTDLFHEIDDCITNLIKARLDKNAENENKAIWNMERLLTNTMQHISWLVGELKGNSQIKWQKGKPKETGTYLVSVKGRFVTTDYWSCIGNKWQYWNGHVKAWCKLNDIEPYKEE